MKSKIKPRRGSVHKNHFDVIIIGGGFAGITLACLLGRAGVLVACLDKGGAPDFPLRTTVINYGAHKILKNAGIWSHVHYPCPIRGVEVLEGDSPVLLKLDSSEAGGKTLGWTVLNSDLKAAMRAALKTHKNVRYLSGVSAVDFEIGPERATARLQNGKKLSAPLIVGADGRNSFVRDWMGARTREWDYHQRAVLCAVQHKNPHNHVAVEHFFSEGPFAVLPMPDGDSGNHRSAVVLTESGYARKNSFMRLTDAAFEKVIVSRFPERCGAIKIIGARAAYPLNFVHAASYIAPRMALIADAAHGIHPIAAQGLNLGLQDAAVLADLIIKANEKDEDPGSAALLARYERSRRASNTAMAAVTDAINGVFASRLPPAGAIGRGSLKAFSNIDKLKQRFIRHMIADSPEACAQ